jgi:hypothetical protein
MAKTIAIKVDLQGTEAQQKKLAKLEAEVKSLTQRRNELNKSLKKGTISLTDYGKEIAKINTKLKANRREMLVARENILGLDSFTKKLGKSFARLGTSIAGAFAGMFAIQKVGQLFSEVINIAKDFEQANANLASVLGTTSDKITALTNDATRLGAATAFSATEVSNLQTEFAKLGFTESQILDATEATLDLAAATGSDLAEAAAIAGATLGGFGLEAKETQKVVDVMAKSFSTSALDIEKFRESMKIAAPAAKAVGVSVEETTALLGTLANAGISGSMAGTGLAKSFIELNKAGLTLQEGLDKVANSNNKLDEAVKLVGVNAAKSFLILAEGTETTKALKTGLESAGGAAKKMADTQLDTLEGKTKILNSAWEGLVLSLTSGNSAFNNIAKNIVEATTSILNFLTASEDAAEVSEKTVKSNRKLINSSRKLLTEYEELTSKGVKPTKEEKEKLDFITLALKSRLGESVVAIDKETGAFKLNTEAVKAQLKLKRLQVDQESAAASARFVNADEEIKMINIEIKANQKALEQAKAVKDEEIAIENARVKITRGRVQQSKRLIEANDALVDAQSNLRRLNERLEEQEERRAENLKILEAAGFSASEAQKAFGEVVEESNVVVEDSNEATGESTDELKKLGITLNDVKKIYKETIEEIDDDPLDIDVEFKEEDYKKASKDRFDFLTKEADKLGELRDKEQEKESEEFAENANKNLQLEFQFEQQLKEQKIALAEQTANALIDVSNRRVERQKTLELAALDAQLEQGLISQEEFEKKREAIERKAFNKQKRLQIAQVAISLATELANIAANSAGNPLNAFSAGAAGAAQNIALAQIAIARSAIQTGIIASQRFAEGGYTGDGYGSPDSTGFKQAGVVHEGEYVVPKHVLESQRGGQLVSALESMRMNKPVSFPSVGFANGGFTSGSNMDLTDMENRISKAVISSIGAIQVTNVATETTNEAIKVNNIISEASFG